MPEDHTDDNIEQPALDPDQEPDAANVPAPLQPEIGTDFASVIWLQFHQFLNIFQIPLVDSFIRP